MNRKDAEETDGAWVSMEISGEYEEVVSKLQSSETDSSHVGPLSADAELVLDTVARIDGGTRSVIAENLPTEMTAPADPDFVVDLLQVLERYDLVTLEGNTWKPGPELQT